jgi:predicted dehydrogenase
MNARLKTVVVGFGRIGAGYADDPVMARHYPFATHAQVLAAHPAFAWNAVVDPAEAARAAARERWKVQEVVSSIDELGRRGDVDVAVLATPPESRLGLIEKLQGLKAVLVEKPLGVTRSDAERFLDGCCRRGILVQVNLWRRADRTFRALAAGGMDERVGRPQAVFCVYGNGLLNNGTHMVDFARMLFGEVEFAQAAGTPVPCGGPIAGDVHVPFSLGFLSGLVLSAQPLGFENYRENAIDIWGERGRLHIAQEGLGLYRYLRQPNRAMNGESEIASDQPEILPSTVGRAFYEMYDNLAAAVRNGEPLWSPGDSALRTEEVISAVKESADRGGARVTLADE